MTRQLRALIDDERGSGEVIATMLIAPVVVAFVVLVFFLGRQVDSRASVRTAAEASAQAAARQRNPTAADEAARATASAMLTDGFACAGGPRVRVDLADFHAGGTVTVAITCTLRTDDLAAVVAPARSFTGTSSAVIDTYRAVSGGTNP